MATLDCIPQQLFLECVMEPLASGYYDPSPQTLTLTPKDSTGTLVDFTALTSLTMRTRLQNAPSTQQSGAVSPTVVSHDAAGIVCTILDTDWNTIIANNYGLTCDFLIYAGGTSPDVWLVAYGTISFIQAP